MTPAPDRDKLVVLDACVIYPTVQREMLLKTARAGLYQPLWSERILEEWRLAVARKQGPEDLARTEGAIARMVAHWPGAAVTADPAAEAMIDLPDPADAHVLGTALAATAPLILTFNLRDFPARALAVHGIAARHPDGFLWEVLSGRTDEMSWVLGGVLTEQRITPDRARAALKRARLPRLGKAWEHHSKAS
ncbi:MAG: PIN domain-containing protein [Pseudomonadota bacterium]